MKTTPNRLIKAILIVAILLVSSQFALAYPPDNAAVLYYRACIWYLTDHTMMKKVTDFSKGKIELDQEIEKYVEKNRRSINFAIDAADVRHCDWGLDYSKGMAMLMPPLSTLRHLGKLILADAKIFAKQGDYESALDRCLSVKKMGRHLSNSCLVSYLVGRAIESMANECIQDILADVPSKSVLLKWFKNQLAEVASKPASVKPAINVETKLVLVSIQELKIDGLSEEKIESLFPTSFAKLVKSRFEAAKEEFFDKSVDYYLNYMADIQTAMDMPYVQAYLRLKELGKKLEKDMIENPNATMAFILTPACAKVYHHGIKTKTSSNAIRAAVEIYIIKAQTGQLPEALPAGLPKDLFSGKPFVYEKTEDGFILRCQGKDLGKDKVYEYEFKVSG